MSVERLGHKLARPARSRRIIAHQLPYPASLHSLPARRDFTVRTKLAAALGALLAARNLNQTLTPWEKLFQQY